MADIYVTLFPDRKAFSKDDWLFDLPGLAEEIKSRSAPAKDALPWLKLARFGEERSKNNSLRWNKNVLGVSGLEIDHDSGKMTFDEAVERMRTARLTCIVYTSPSYERGTKERWRVLAPFSRERAPALRAEMVAVVNGVLDGAAAGESFTLSQSFLYGRVEGRELRLEVIEGDYVDLRPDLYGARRYKDKKPRKEARAGPAPVATPVSEREIAAALEVIDPDCPYEVWLRVAAALRHQLGEDGFGLFDQWSARAEGAARSGGEMYTIAGTERQWDAVATMTDITIGTVFHYANQADPTWRARYEAENTQRMMERLREVGKGEERPDAAGCSSPTERLPWLLATHAYCAATDTVVELDEPSDGCQMRVVAFQRLFRAWFEEEVGPRDGVKRHYATAAWELSEARINVRGVRMRPDKPFPLYQENGATYKNTYLRPKHEGSGDIAPWLAFMEHLVPAAEEREWFCNWLAHKHRFPGVPGVAVVMVAVDDAGPVYGAGRGILRDIVARLLGPKYVKPI
ncbi:MAG TPA: PriCT-2 domain-containing protein, partial [Vicinamibacterales bacterium]|nr:PriCT-2 domain-containing protein [Vicinamibacterales bacterium]